MALLNKNHVKSLVAVGIKNQEGNFVCNATSFLVGFLFKESEKPEERLYRTFLVTNRHVFQNRLNVFLRFNTGNTNKVFEQPLTLPDGTAHWLAHPDPMVDLALLNVNPDILKENKVDPIFISEEMFGYYKDFDSIGISVGDDVYAIGFPMGIAGEEQNYPCVKAGIISRIDNEIINSKKAFIIDSSIFPGNSGGPVILKPTIASLSDTKSVSKPFLLGVISGYIPYSEQLYTHQTNPPTVASQTRENSGLSFCVPIDYVKEIYDSWLKNQKPIENPQKNNTPEDIQEEVKSKVE